MPKEEIDYMAWLQNGDRRGISYFFEQHYSALCYFAGKITKDTEIAREIVSDAFIELWKRGKDFKTANSIKGFLYKVVRNRCLNHLDTVKRENNNKKALALLVVDATVLTNSLVRAELFDLLDQEREKRSGRLREVLDYYMQGLPVQQIAARMQITDQTVRNHLHRFSKLMREILNERF